MTEDGSLLLLWQTSPSGSLWGGERGRHLSQQDLEEEERGDLLSSGLMRPPSGLGIVWESLPLASRL